MYIRYGTETLAHLGPKVWEIDSTELKEETNSLKEFKNKIKKWKPDNGSYKHCRTYSGGVGYIE